MIKIIFQIFIILVFMVNVNIYGAKYKGEKINLVFKDADLKNVLMLFAEYEDKNFLIDENIKGKVTIRLKNVPWDQALQIILDTKDLAKITEGNVIRIIPKDYIRKKEREKRKLAEEKRKALEAKKRLEPLVTEIIDVNFAKAEEISGKASAMLSKRGKLITDSRTNSLIVTDIKKNINDIKKLLKVLDRATKQVVIEAKILVIKNTASKELGIQWGGSLVQRINSKDFFYGINGGSATPPSTSIFPPGTSQKSGNYQPFSITGTDYIVNTPTVQAPVGSLGLIFGKWGYYNLSVKLTALKSKNMAKEISSPKVIALDNEKAVIEQGQEIPYKTVSDSGTKTEFKDAKLKLEVTPHITSNKMILLDINLSKDSIGQQTTDGPAINTQEVKTKLLLGNGETAVIGGILSNSKSEGEDSVPFFSDLPIIGGLFKNEIKSNIKGELLIFITPRIVERDQYNEQANVASYNKNFEKIYNIDKNFKKKRKLKKGDYAKVNAIVLNFRKKPVIEDNIIGKIKEGEKVKILDSSKAPWYYISYKGKKGWVFKYLGIK